MSQCIPWDELTEGYYQGLSTEMGRPEKDVVYQTRGGLSEAKRTWQMSLKLFIELGSPSAQRVQAWLDRLAEAKQ